MNIVYRRKTKNRKKKTIGDLPVQIKKKKEPQKRV